MTLLPAQDLGVVVLMNVNGIFRLQPMHRALLPRASNNCFWVSNHPPSLDSGHCICYSMQRCSSVHLWRSGRWLDCCGGGISRRAEGLSAY